MVIKICSLCIQDHNKYKDAATFKRWNMSVDTKIKYLVTRHFGQVDKLENILIRIAKLSFENNGLRQNNGNDKIEFAKHPIIMPTELEAK